MAKLTGPLFGVKDGDVYPTRFEAGEDCPTELEAAAAETGVLEADEADEANAGGKKATAPGENKATKPAENK